MTKRKKFLLILIATFCIIASCCFMLFMVSIFSDNSDTLASTPTVVSLSTEIPELTSSTEVPYPAFRTEITDLTFAEIENEYDTLDREEWKNYYETIKGNRVHWIAEVRDGDDDKLFLDMGQKGLRSILLEGNR